MAQEYAAGALAQTRFKAVMAEQNPCSAQLPPTPTKLAAMSELTRGLFVRTHRAVGGAAADHADLLLGNDELALLLINVAATVREGYSARDLRRADFRARVITASEFVHHSSGQHGHTLSLPAANLPDAKPRGVLVIAQARMGRRVIADAIQDFIGRNPRPLTVEVSQGQIASYWMLPVLRVQWPAGGSLRKFAEILLRSFDAAMGTRLSLLRHGPFRRNEVDIRSALCALGVATNLGLLIVERINTRDASGPSAEKLWDTLGQFTRITGIPVLSMATPGAAAALSEQSSAAGELSASGLHTIVPQERGSRKWSAVSKAIFDANLRTQEFCRPPQWFDDALWDVSRALNGLASGVCRYVDSRLSSEQLVHLDEARFRELAAEALVLEQPHIDILHSLASPGRYTLTSLRRHGDWLPLRHALATVPRLLLEQQSYAVIQ
ncbi:hypothetical protein LMG7141_02344 [Ralstonia condita]|uniref:Uncharacterized protein n=1 Tax=Ralstonia condita TaxID=3058600 RepID=A0ABN9IQN7_9RALS|nr:hypothetical protein [Ralstonia sp. LMG 7141]CAJ0790285.1 hypothetical protein LMG7141_02344 [Ralstonia sp. LMG 7141]